jgi:hypothetical protein
VLSFTLAALTSTSYNSTLTSYIKFCQLHNIALTPTPDTFSLYIVWMYSYIRPSSIDSYLSGICNKLEDKFPNVHKVHHSQLLQQTLAGCKHCFNHTVTRKQLLSHNNLYIVFLCYHGSTDHDDILFLTQLHFCFETLQCLGELVWPDSVKLQSYNRFPMHHTVEIDRNTISYMLPLSKTDKF